MKYLPISKVPVMEEEDATGAVAEIFDEIRATQGIPSVGIINLAAAASPAPLISGTRFFNDFMQRATLPPPLLFMIHYTISTLKNCKCCSAGFKVACRSVGVDEEMLEALVSNLDAINPRRAQEIIKFAINCVLDPQGLTEADYDRVREQGVSEEELVEIIGWAAFVAYHDTLADAMKFDDPQRQQVMEGDM